MSNKILNICQSKLKESKSTFIWMIENFPDRLNQYLDSGIFRSTSPNGDTLGWGLRIYTSTSLEAPPYFGISIHRVDSATEVSAKIKFMIRNSAGMDVIELTIPNRIYTNCHPYQQQPIYYLISRNELLDVRNGLMQGNQLTIVFEVTIFGKPSLEMRSSIFDEFEVPECSGMEDLGNLFEQGLFTDCTIIAAADGTKFNAHKGILACRSPVFRAMFEHGMIEAKGIVKIKDIKAPVLEQMIRFIYSGKAPKLGEMTEELFEAADQYKLDRLKILCESELAKTMSNENVCELLVLADQHCANNLKTYAIKYIQMNAKEVMKSIGWKMVIKGNHAELMGQIMKAFTE